MKTKLLILLTMLFACVIQVKGEVIISNDLAVVGFGTDEHSGIGFCDFYKNYSSQTLYTAKQVGHFGKITSISYEVASVPENPSAIASQVKIYMAMVGYASLKDNLATDPTKLTEVFDGNINTFKTTGWHTVNLTTPFEYTGGNLLVVVECQRSEYSKVSYRCAASTEMSYHKHLDADSNYANAFNGSDFSDFGKTPNTRFAITSESKAVQVGNGTANSNWIGFSSNFLNQAMQSLYLGSEIGESGYISKLSFQLSSTASSNAPVNSVKVWLAEVETSMTTLSSSNKLNTANMTLVFDGAVSEAGLSAGNWLSVTFDTPFYFNNNKNLVVAVSNSSTAKNTVMYRGASMSNRTVVNTNSNDPNTVSSPSGYLPNARFGFLETTVIGTEVNRNYALGYGSTNKECSFQSLFLNTEVGNAGLINNLAFQLYASSSDRVLLPVKIWMAEVPQTTLTKDTKLSTSNMTLVYDGNVELGGKKQGDWIGADLMTLFPYTGMGSLVIAVASKQTDNHSDTFMATSQSSRTVYNMDSSDPNSASQNSSYIPNTRLSFAIHDCGTTYSANGFGICKNCQKELLYEFKKPTDISGYSDYRISNVGELMWFSRAVNKGQAGTGYWGYLSNDIDLTGYNWIPIGNDTNPMKCRLYGYDRNTTVGHTISGIPSTSSLLGTFSGVLYSLRLTSGALVNKGSDGTIYSCLTLGSALVKSGTASINNSYYLSTSTADAARGARTAAQMKSGQVTYELSQSSNSKWYQTLGTDDYPMVSGTDKVYRYTQCPSTTKYTNNSELSGTVQGHNLVNTVCSNCNEEPTTISQDMTLVDNKPYLRKKSATISSGHKVTYSRNFNSMSNWYPLYLPFAVQYNSTLAQNVEIAELSAYGVKDDTNNDGNINSQDQRKLTMSLLKVGDTTEPNKPYLVRAKKTGTISFPSYGATLAKNDENSLALSTMKETFVATGCYSSKTVTPAKTNGKMLNSNGTSFNGVSSSASCSQFRWTGEISNNNGTAWDQSLLPIVFTDCAYPEFAIVDNETSSYKRATEVTVKNFSYSRIFADRQIGNWQSLYLPFDLTMTSDMLEDVEIARLDDVTTKAGVDYFVVTKLESGQTLEANTLAVIRIKDSALDEDHYWNLSFDQVTLKPAANTKKVFETDQAKYTFTGVYEPYSNDVSTWYAIAKSDGLLHEAASGAKLPAYRFYMTIDGGTTSAAEIRIGFLENDPFATGIREVEEDDNQTGVYTLDGRRVQSESVQPGIYVKNGKKIWVK